MQLSEHFSLAELTYSATAIDHNINNIPLGEELKNLKFCAIQMEMVRKILWDKPIMVTSGYRGPSLNKLVGGVKTSQHSKGQAIDFFCTGFGTPRQICKELMKHRDTLQYDQLILEPTWVHISFVQSNPRMRELTYVSRTEYLEGIK